jgi:hypothetical protein
MKRISFGFSVVLGMFLSFPDFAAAVIDPVTAEFQEKFSTCIRTIDMTNSELGRPSSSSGNGYIIVFGAQGPTVFTQNRSALVNSNTGSCTYNDKHGAAIVEILKGLKQSLKTNLERYKSTLEGCQDTDDGALSAFINSEMDRLKGDKNSAGAGRVQTHKAK